MKTEEGNVLIDTSAWVEFFRGTSKTAVAVANLIEAGKALLCGVVRYELMQGAKSAVESSHLSGVLSALPYIEMTSDLWTKAGNISAMLRIKGITLPMSDILIAAIALEHNIEVLTLDTHFASIGTQTV
ncbi:type II toxin-antitoxin system VapC family toxin [Candidatus Magnetomonas plexicatena]|uniref:type II toxin-antitoxin system VapC family toxin n=1 Tax=Candidatus Magnetomonas plexicatena TaxID=2552947 RepID=UPI0011046F33|nr:PIN domain-containing protein [Nitrospirales bacterium LBB_01]